VQLAKNKHPAAFSNQSLVAVFVSTKLFRFKLLFCEFNDFGNPFFSCFLSFGKHQPLQDISFVGPA
jgi:hypothetical protein